MKKLSIVVPTYNEETRINSTLRKMNEYFEKSNYQDYQIIISDDGSTDKTLEIVKKYKEIWKNLELLENKHRGKAPTVLSGLDYASGSIVAFIDADLAVDINDLDKLLTPIQNGIADVVIASREKEGAVRVNEPKTRHIMGRVFNFIVQALVLRGIDDTQCGFKAFTKEAFNDIYKNLYVFKDLDKEIDKPRVSAFDIEVLFLAKKLNYTIAEVGITWTYFGDSKVHNIKDSYYNLKDVINVWLANLKGNYNLDNYKGN